MTESVNKKVTSNLIWRLLERFGAQAVTFLVSIVLARLLDPAVYGTIALVTVFTTILQVFVDSGLGSALIQKKDADDVDFSTVFYFNIVVCFVFYAAMFFLAPFVADFYEKPDLSPVIRVLSLTIVISGVKNVQQAYVSKHMLFKRFFFATLGGTIGAAIIGIVFAYLGCGVWALVAQHLFNLAVDTIILWVTVKWRPKKMFSFVRLKVLFSFGWKLLVSALLDTGYRELRSLIIGKQYSAEDLAYYNRGQQFPNLIVTNINTSIDSVLLPTMANVQDNKERVKAMTRRAIKTSTYIMMPLMVGLAVCAEPIVRLILTEKWLPAVFFLRIFCFAFAFYPINTANLNAIKAMGRSDYFLWLEVIKKAVGLVALFATMFISVEAMAYSLLVTTVLGQIINAWPNRKLLGYSYFIQLRDILPQILLSAAMGGVVFCVTFISIPDWAQLLIQVPLGGLVYLGISYLLRFESLYYIINTGKSFLKGRKKNVVVVSGIGTADRTSVDVIADEKANAAVAMEPKSNVAVIQSMSETNTDSIACPSNEKQDQAAANVMENGIKPIDSKAVPQKTQSAGAYNRIKERFSNLELFRIIVMILIIAHHYVVNSGLTASITADPLSIKSLFLTLFGAFGKTGINCFVLITGYFMCKSKPTPKKFFKLLFEVMFYKITIYLIFLISGYEAFSWIGLAKALLPITGVHTNFTGTFLIFYLLLPFLGILVSHLTEKQHIALLAVTLGVYVILGTIPKITVSMNYVTWYCCLYFVASYIRLYPKKRDQSAKFWGIIALILFVLSCTSVIALQFINIKLNLNEGIFGYYLLSDSNKFLAVALSISAFMFFKNIKIKQNKVINVVAASTFGVLLIHAHSDAMRQWLWVDLLKNVEMCSNGNWIYLHAIASVLGIFVVCSFIDIARTYLIEPHFLKFLMKIWDKFYKWFSNIFLNKIFSNKPSDE